MNTGPWNVRMCIRLHEVQAGFSGGYCEDPRGLEWSGKASWRKQEFEPKLEHLN